MDLISILMGLAGGAGAGFWMGRSLGATKRERAEFERQLNAKNDEVLHLKRQLPAEASRAGTLEHDKLLLGAELSEAKAEIARLKDLLRHSTEDAAALKRVREQLQKGGQVNRLFQPVLFLGPKEVGKTSLLWEWNSPWVRERPTQTKAYHYADVTVHYMQNIAKGPHFADRNVLVDQHVNLFMRAYDFPGEQREDGEVMAHDQIEQIAIQATVQLRQDAQKLAKMRPDFDDESDRLGIVIICMYDCAAFLSNHPRHHEIEDRLARYYHANFFASLKKHAQKAAVNISRIIVVFNKFDEMRAAHPGKSDLQLMKIARAEFDAAQLFGRLTGLVAEKEIKYVGTIVNPVLRHESRLNGGLVKWYATQTFLEVLLGHEVATEFAIGADALNAAAMPAEL